MFIFLHFMNIVHRTRNTGSLREIVKTRKYFETNKQETTNKKFLFLFVTAQVDKYCKEDNNL